MLEPTEIKDLTPEACSCGNNQYDNTKPYYTHQVIELPEIQMEVTHLILYKCECPCCGKINKAVIPKEHRTGFGPRLSAIIAQRAGNMGDSLTIVQDVLRFWDFISGWGASRKLSTARQKPLNPTMKPSQMVEIGIATPLSHGTFTTHCRPVEYISCSTHSADLHL